MEMRMDCGELMMIYQWKNCRDKELGVLSTEVPLQEIMILFIIVSQNFISAFNKLLVKQLLKTLLIVVLAVLF